MLEESTTMWVEVRGFVFGLVQGWGFFGSGLAVYAWAFPRLSRMLDRKTDSWTDRQIDRQSTDPNKVAQQSSRSCRIFFCL